MSLPSEFDTVLVWEGTFPHPSKPVSKGLDGKDSQVVTRLEINCQRQVEKKLDLFVHVAIIFYSDLYEICMASVAALGLPRLGGFVVFWASCQSSLPSPRLLVSPSPA